jgi:hypothetical protein
MTSQTKTWLRPVGRGWHLAAAAPIRVEALKAAAEYLGWGRHSAR